MTFAHPMRTFVAPHVIDPQRHVEPSTFERLRVMVQPHGWEPMLTATPEAYRAWMRHTSGTRMFARPADSAEQAARNLIAKVERWAR